MTDLAPSDQTKLGTWGGFIKHALEHGVTVEAMAEITYPDGRVGYVKFLQRVVSGEVLTYPLPMDCTPDRKLGFGRFALICARLKIRECDGWPIAF